MTSKVLLFANNAQGTLAAPISNVALSLTLSAGQGALFPNPTANETFLVSLTDDATGLESEIALCTARVADVLTIVRAQEGTTARNWLAGDIVAQLNTAGTTRKFQQQNLPQTLLALTNVDVTLTSAQYQSQQFLLLGVLTGDVNILLPDAITGLWAIKNSTTGAHVVTFKTASGTGGVVAQDGNLYVFNSDGTNVGTLAYTSGSLPTVASGATIKAGTDNTQFASAAALLSALGFTALFTSSNQTITAAGALTIAHGLARAPVPGQMTAYLIETDAGGDQGYAVGSKLPVIIGQQSSTIVDDYGMAVLCDATNISVRFGSGAGVFPVLNFGTGGHVAIDLTKWKIVFQVWG